MPNSKKTNRKSGPKPVARADIPASKLGFDPAQLKRSGRSGRGQRFGRGKPPRFPGRTGGR